MQDSRAKNLYKISLNIFERAIKSVAELLGFDFFSHISYFKEHNLVVSVLRSQLEGGTSIAGSIDRTVASKLGSHRTVQIGADMHPYCVHEEGKPDVKAEQLTLAAGTVRNQREAGYPNGCTPFASAFLTLSPKRDCSPEMISNLLQHGSVLHIVPEMNEMPVAWLQRNPIGLEAVCSKNPSIVIHEEEIAVLEVQEGFELPDFYTEIEDIFRAQGLIGFLITTGTETLAVRFRENSIEILDPHGDSTQRAPACVISFSNDAAGKEQVSEFLAWRTKEALLGDFPQVSFTPVKSVSPSPIDYFEPCP